MLHYEIINFLNRVFEENRLNFFSDDGKFLSLRDRIIISKKRAKITSEIVNRGEPQIKNLSLFKFLVRFQNIQKILIKIIIFSFGGLLVLHIFFIK